MTLTLLYGTGNPPLGNAVAERLGLPPGGCEIGTFPDGELHMDLRVSVRGHDVYILQSVGPPAERHLLELLLLTDACRRAGASRVSAVIPYFAYARQDRRTTGREAVGARVVADLLETARYARVVAVDLHSPALEGFLATPVEHLSAVPVLAAALGGDPPANGVVVAPDAGAARLAERYAEALELPVAIVQKVRLSGSDVAVRSVTGDVAGRAPIIVDDMISTGGTIAAAVAALRAAGCRPAMTVVATHGVLVGPSGDRLAALPLERLLVTDTLPIRPPRAAPLSVVSVAPLLADAIARLHADRSLGALLAHVERPRAARDRGDPAPA